MGGRGERQRLRRPRHKPKSLLPLGDHLVDGGKRRARFVGFTLGAKRVGLVEKLVDLLLVGFAQGVGIDLVLHDFLGGGELLGALAIGRFLILRVGGSAQEASDGDTD